MRIDVYGEGPALVLVPGLGCDARMWGAVLDAMELPVTALVPRAWEARTMPEAALGIRAALDERGVTRAFFAGLSMGGYVVFECLKRLPEMVRAAALLDTTALPDTEERTAARNRVLKLLEAGKFDDVLGTFASSVLWAEGAQAPVARQTLMAMARALGPEAYARSAAAIRDRGSYLPTLQATQVPLLFLAGAHDTLSPPALASEMARMARHAQAVVIPDAGHMTALENPAAVAAAFDDFFRRFLAPA